MPLLLRLKQHCRAFSKTEAEIKLNTWKKKKKNLSNKIFVRHFFAASSILYQRRLFWNILKKCNTIAFSKNLIKSEFTHLPRKYAIAFLTLFNLLSYRPHLLVYSSIHLSSTMGPPLDFFALFYGTFPFVSEQDSKQKYRTPSDKCCDV